MRPHFSKNSIIILKIVIISFLKTFILSCTLNTLVLSAFKLKRYRPKMISFSGFTVKVSWFMFATVFNHIYFLIVRSRSMAHAYQIHTNQPFVPWGMRAFSVALFYFLMDILYNCVQLWVCA